MAYKWSALDWEEIYAELSLKLVERRAFIRRSDNPHGAAVALMRREAAMYASNERTRAIHGTAQYLYGTDETAVMLDSFLRHIDQWEEGAPTFALDGGGHARDGMNYVTGLTDVSRAWDGLHDAAREVLYRVTTIGAAETAALEGTALKTVQRRYKRALGTLTDRMNAARVNQENDHEGPGARRAMSNATARAVTAHDC